MKPSAIYRSLETLFTLRQPTFLWGPPGVGKSQVVAQVASQFGGLIDVRAVLLDPVDLRGLPTINGDGRAHWCPPEFLPRDGPGVLFLDELPQAPPLVQNACMQLVLDRKIGEYVLPDGWVVCAAGNRETDRAHTTRMSSALANRFVHLDFEVDLDDWSKWAIGAGVMIEVVAFLRFRPELIHVFDPAQKAFPTPRSWEFVSRIVKTCPPKDLEYDMVKGTVGEGAATEFVGFLRVFRSLPSPDAVLLNPDAAAVPTDPATLYALAGALARKASDANFDRVVRYASRLPDEFGVLLVRDAVLRTPSLQSTRPFIEWAAANSNVLI